MSPKKSDVLHELEKLRARRKGLLRPRDVVDFARDPDTALHGSFNWDDTDAAECYRLCQARQIIRVTVRVVPEIAEPIRAFVSLREDRAREGGGYRDTVHVLSDKEQRARLLSEAEGDMNTFRRKYRILKDELAPVFAAMDGVLKGDSTKGRKRAAG